MLVSAPGGLIASAATERNDRGDVLESADYADYADKESEKLEQHAGSRSGIQEKNTGANTSSFLLLPLL